MCVGPYCLDDIFTDYLNYLSWYEYIIFVIVLIISLAIGVFYGFFGSKNKTNEEFLMAGRSMTVLPVAMSLISSFVSAVTFLGNPAEVYYYGQQFTLIIWAYIPMTVALAYLYVPVYFDLQLTSAYEYFEWRFSLSVRTMCTIFGLLHMIIYMPITVLGPSLAIDAVADFDYRISAAVICMVCIGYSSLGGLKAVLWTDVLQTGVMYIALIAICVCGTIEVGGFNKAWEIAESTGRTNVLNFDPDPRARHTFWTSTVGGLFMYLTLFAATQAQIQRYNSVPTLRQSRQCLLYNMLGMISVVLLCSYLGLLLYAFYFECDPVSSGIVDSSDQLLPLFVADALRNYPSLPGLLLAGITCGTLSTISSSLNSTTALITEDFVKRYRPHWDEIKLGYTSKIISTATGFFTFGMVFIVRILNSYIPIAPFATLVHGSLIGPILGAFSLGMFFPWTNNLGILLGLIASIVLTGFIGLGTIFASVQGLVPNQRLDLTLQGCLCDNGTTFCSDKSDFLELPDNSNWKENGDSVLVQIFSVSYIWQPGVGTMSTLVFGIVFSLLVILLDKSKRKKVHAKLLSKPFIAFWNAVLGKSIMENWIDYDEQITFEKDHKG